MPVEPQALIFDYGNVLCQPQESSDIQGMAAVFGISAAEFELGYWRYRMQYDQAALETEAYWKKIAADLQRVLNDDDIAKLMTIDVRSWTRPNPVMLEWARRLREAGLKTAVLSNMPLPLREHLRCCAPWLPDFDHMTFSCDVRVCKPDPEIYRLCLEGLGVAPEEALFLDDRAENVEAARTVGMHAFQFASVEQAAAGMDGQFRLPAALT
jgi:putative hydrolase of the HAD superfamily